MIEMSKCVMCGKEMNPSKRGPKRKYCSAKCKNKRDNKVNHAGLGTRVFASGNIQGSHYCVDYPSFVGGSSYITSKPCQMNLHNACSGKKTHNIPCECECHGRSYDLGSASRGVRI